GGDPAREATWLASRRDARRARGQTGIGEPCRLRAVLLSQRETLAPERQRTVLLSAKAREPPRSAPVERRLQLRPGRARHPTRDDPGHGPHRNDPRRVRDGRDSL